MNHIYNKITVKSPSKNKCHFSKGFQPLVSQVQGVAPPWKRLLINSVCLFSRFTNIILKKAKFGKSKYHLLIFLLFSSLNLANSQAIATNDTINTYINTGVIIDVRANDTYADSMHTGYHCLNFPPQNGTFEVLNEDSIRYIPNFNFSGTDEFVYSIAPDENHCFGILDTAKVVIHVQESGLTLLGRWDIDTLVASSGFAYNDIWGYTDCEQNEYAIIASRRFIHFVNITNADSLYEVAAFAGGGNSLWRDMKTYRDRAYAAAQRDQEGLMIFDLSQVPDSVSKSNQTNAFFSNTHNIFIDEENGRLYTAGADSMLNGVIVLDLTTNPDEPVLLSKTLLEGGYVHDIFVRDNIAYCSHGGNGLYVYDMTDPANPITLGSLTSYPESGYNHSSWLSEDGSHLVFADETFGTSLKMANVSDLGDIYVTDLFKSANWSPYFENSIAHNPFVRGNYVIASYYHEGVQVFDITKPDSVSRVAFYDTHPANINYNGFQGCWGVYPFFPSGKIIASDVLNGLIVLEAKNINFAPISRPTYPDASLSIEGEPALCESDSVLLSVPAGAMSYEWFDQDVSLGISDTSITTSNVGDYSAVIANQHCQRQTETVTVTKDTIPFVEVSSSGDIQFCEDENVTLTATDTFNVFSWIKDGINLEDSTLFITVNETGIYHLKVINGACTGISAPIEVVSHPYPDVTLDIRGETEFCEGGNVELYLLEGAQQYQWVQNDMPIPDGVTNTFNPMESGDYFVIASNLDCISISDTVAVTVFEVTIPEISVDNNILSSTEAPAYQWYRDDIVIDGATEQTYIATQTGSYLVETTSEDGCLARSASLAISVNTVQEVALKAIHIHPNPVGAVLQIIPENLENQDYHLQLYSITGKLLQQHKGALRDNQVIKVPFEDLPTGTYILEFVGEKVKVVQRIIKE